MERLVRLAAVLKVAGAEGVSAEKLVRVSGFDGDNAMDQLGKDLRHLRAQGWQIDNVAEPGEAGRFRMVTVDNRFRVRLSPAQQRALQRAVLLADRADLVERLGLPADSTPPDVQPTLRASPPDERLSTVVGAVRHRCLLHFRYGGRERTVHPESVRHQNEKWYLRGVEGADASSDEAQELKVFVVARMSEVRRDAPGSARRVEAEQHLTLHPMRWEVDPPVEVVLRVDAAFRPDVERWLGTPETVRDLAGSGAGAGAGDELELTYRVTNRAALRVRLYELGTRVRLVGPEEVRREVVAELSAAAAGSAGESS